MAKRRITQLTGLATVNLYTNYEVSMFTHYEDMKGAKKMQKLGWFGGLMVTQGHRKHNHSIEHIRHPIRI